MGSRGDQADQRIPERLTVRTVPVSDPGDLIGVLPDPDALAWIRHGEGLAAWGAAATITLPAGLDRFTTGEKWLREVFDTAQVDDEIAEPGSGPVAFGSFTFDPASEGSVLVVPRAVLGRRAGRAWLTTIDADQPREREPAAPGQPRGTRWPPDGGQVTPLTIPAGITWADGSLSAPEWERAVAAAVEAISAGGLRKVVLAMDLCATASRPIDARVLLGRLAASYPDCYTFACAGLVGATPELLIRRDGDRVHSLVLAGTTPRGATAEQDDALGAGLLGSAKDLDEHSYAVADVGGALRPLCSWLRVEPAPTLLRLANVQHLATRVDGQLAPAGTGPHLPSALALAAALHPTAAVGGTPAEAAMDLIRELECMDRGRYGGPVGWVDSAGNGEWGIALRCGQLDGRRARLFAGCGIVADSRPAAELAETQAKFRPMRHALDG